MNNYNKNRHIEIRKQLDYTNDLNSLCNGRNNSIMIKNKRYSKVLELLKKKNKNFLIA
jgi:hypothetical protein